MGILRVERRSEPRTHADFAATVWGVDTRGEHFLQQAKVRDISFSGALLSGIEADLRCGDVIGVLYMGKKARYRVIWIRYDDGGDNMQTAIRLFETDLCPWQELLNTEGANRAQPSANLRPEWR